MAKVPNDYELEFLKECTQDELAPLVGAILGTDDNGDIDCSGRFSSELDKAPAFKANYPDHTKYVDEIIEEVQKFGGNTFANIFRGDMGVSYHEVLCDVAKKMKGPRRTPGSSSSQAGRRKPTGIRRSPPASGNTATNGTRMPTGISSGGRKRARRFRRKSLNLILGSKGAKCKLAKIRRFARKTGIWTVWHGYCLSILWLQGAARKENMNRKDVYHGKSAE